MWAGEVTNDSFAAVRAVAGRRWAARGVGRVGRSAGPSRTRRPRLGSLTVLGPPRGQGRWSLAAREWRTPDAGLADAIGSHARAAVLLERHGVLDS